MTGSVNEDEPGFYALYYSLKDISKDNVDFFKEDATASGKRLYRSFSNIMELMDAIIESVRDISKNIELYDFDNTTPANGYRSFILAAELIIKRTLILSRIISNNRNSYFFRKNYHSRELEACGEVIESLSVILGYLKVLISWSDSGHLFPAQDHHPTELLCHENNNFFVNQYPFYGRCVGFQFCESISLIFKALSILMASFSEFYYSDGKVIDFLLNGSKYLVNPELRAKRLVNISQYSSVDFCKAFWFLGEMELMQRLPSISFSSLQVNKVILIETKPLTVPSVDQPGERIQVPIPTSHKDAAPIPVRLLSASYYFGMSDVPIKEGVKDSSPGLVFHCHGGGFVAQSSRSHETYLRQWATSISAPILSVDYSLAPECPFPRALDEVFYAYCWALQNAQSLGSTAQRIVVAGDSAGANLNMGLVQKCLTMGVRPPDGVFLAYAPIILNFVPSPSRLLCLMDPLLPFGFLMACTKAYACAKDVYTKSKAHEYKLERSLPLRNIVVDNDQAVSTKQDSDDITDGAEDERGEERPILMEKRFSQTIYNFLSSIMSAFSDKFNFNKPACPDAIRLENEMQMEAFLPCPRDMMDVEIDKDPLFSPYYMSDQVLSRFPPVSLLSTHFDPFLDDCIEFAKKLRSVGTPVTLDVLEGLSHGFLNFSMVYCRYLHDLRMAESMLDPQIESIDGIPRSVVKLLMDLKCV